MLLRFLRTSSLVGLVALVLSTVIFQFYGFVLAAPIARIQFGPVDVSLEFGKSVSADWELLFDRLQDAGHQLGQPKFAVGFDALFAAVPWWLLLLIWAPSTALIWRMSRRRKPGGAFPIDAALTGRSP